MTMPMDAFPLCDQPTRPVAPRSPQADLPLHRPRPVHPLPHGLTGLAAPLVRKRAVLHGRHLEMDVDAVEQRSRDACEVALDAERSADAVVLRIAEIAAGTSPRCLFAM